MSATTVMRLCVLSILALVLTGCGSDSCGPGDPCRPARFEVRVLTTGDEPVEGAWVVGGFDWTRYGVRTDASGVALVPESGRGRFAEIHKNNFYPITISALEPKDYYIGATPARLERVGEVVGRSIRFDADLLITLGYSGPYRAYSYDESTVTELARVKLEAAAIVDHKFVGNTLWLSTHDEGVYAYSLEDPLSPLLLRHLEIEGYLGPIAVRGNTIAVASRDEHEPVRVFSFTPEGETSLLSTFRARLVLQMDYRSQFLLVVSSEGRYFPSAMDFRVVDMVDPSSPDVVYSLVEQGARSGLILDYHVLLGPYATESGDFVSYATIFIGDPGDPAYVGKTTSRVWLESVSGGSHAVGSYCPENSEYPWWCSPYSESKGVAVGGVQSTFNAIAVLTEMHLLGRSGVQRPPYFVIGDALWRLEEDDRVVGPGRAAGSP